MNKYPLNKLIVAVDFDGTCVTHEFPKVGREIGAGRVLKRLTDAGVKLILFTMRSDNRKVDRLGAELPEDLMNPLADAVNWFKERDIPLWGINENPEQKTWTSSPKAYAHYFIDDAAVGCPLIRVGFDRYYVDWLSIEKFFFHE